VRLKYFGGTHYLYHRPTHKWYYLSNQSTEEALLMKIFDSKQDAPASCKHQIQVMSLSLKLIRAQGCPHASFKHPYCPENAPPRKSIEVRALVFTSDQG
jgi:hypothetical protein